MSTSARRHLLEVSIGGGIVGFLMFLNCVTSSGEALEDVRMAISMSTVGWVGVALMAAALGAIGWCCSINRGSTEKQDG